MIKKLLNCKVFVTLGAIFTCALWGISTPIVKMGYEYIDESHVPSLLLWVGLMFVFAAFLTVGGYSVFYKNFLCPKKESLKGVAIVAVLQTVLLKHNPAPSVTIYSFTTPVFGVIFSALLLSEDGGVAITNLIIALVLVCAGIILWGYEKKPKVK